MLGVDHKWRDLPVYAYLKELLERKYGFDVALVRRTWETSYLAAFRPDIVVFEALAYPQWARLARELREAGVRIVILPTEGAPIDEPNKLQLSGAGLDYSMVDLFCSWNGEIAERTRRSLPAERIELTGCPRFDIYRPPLDRLVRKREALLRDLRLPGGAKVVTFASNFVLAGMATRNRDFLARDWKDARKDRTGVGWYDDPHALAATEVRTREVFLEAAERTARETGLSVILRPHPGEDQVVYRDFVRGLTGLPVRLAATEYIWNVLNATDVLVTRASTTSVEAWLLDRPTIEFRANAGDFSGAYVAEYAPGSEEAASVEATVRLAREYAAGRPVPEGVAQRRRAIVEKYFHAVDGRSSERFAVRLRRLAEDMEYPQGKDARLVLGHLEGLARLGVRELKGFLNGPLMRHVMGRSGAVDYMGRFDRFIYPADIRRWVRTIRATGVVSA
jgi:surface carbohydrate biosynthesis protein